MTTTTPSSVDSLDSVARMIAPQAQVVLLTHVNPDGDAVGSVTALARALRASGRRVFAYMSGLVSPSLRELAGDLAWSLVDRVPPDAKADVIGIIDTGSRSQLPFAEEFLRARRESAFILDHHRAQDDIAASRFVDASASSATMLVARLLDAMGLPITPEVANPLFAGLATDTGWFRFSSAGSEALRLAARLIDAGADRDGLYQLLEETNDKARLAIEARALAGVEYVGDGSVALMSLGPEDFVATGASRDMLSGLVNAPMMVGVVRMSVLLTEADTGLTKISLRGKPAGGRYEAAPVEAVARALGGGGHLLAAGARLKMSRAAARTEVLRVLQATSRGSG